MSQFKAISINYSTLTGSTIVASTLTNISTISGSTLSMSRGAAVSGSNATTTTGVMTVTNTATTNAINLLLTAPNMTTGQFTTLSHGQSASSNNAINSNFYYIGAGSAANYCYTNGYGNGATGGLSITMSGNVGIGITNPGALFEVAGSMRSGSITLNNTNVPLYLYNYGALNYSAIYADSGGNMTFATGTSGVATRMLIGTTGDIFMYNNILFNTTGSGITGNNSASYGSVTAYGSKNGHAGYNINNRYTFMASGDAGGLHDVNHGWLIRSVNNNAYFDRGYYEFASSMQALGAITGNPVYTNEWFRVKSGGGLYWDTYARGIFSPESGGNSYGNICTAGTPLGGWAGYGIGSRYCVMSNGSSVGIHDNIKSWCIQFDDNKNCTISASLTVTGTITGNLTGNITGSAGTAGYANSAGTAASCTGNAATATTAGSCTGNAASATTAASCSGNAASATVLSGVQDKIFVTSYITIHSSNNLRYYCPLYVGTLSNGSQGFYLYDKFYTRTGQAGSPNANLSEAVSIACEGWCATNAAFAVLCDRRVKKNIEPVSSMLPIINKIEVVAFDKITHNVYKRDECSVIAQQVQSVFPNAITISKGTVANIMKCAEIEEYNDNVKINVDIDNTPDNIKDITIGSNIKLYILCNGKDKEIEHMATIIDFNIELGTIIVSKWDNFNILDNVFVYGSEVNDYLLVDKDKLGTMALQGVKELSQIIEKQEEIIKTQQSQLDKLTQWAITQGYT